MVDEDAAPPVELRLSWQCERFSCLPESGGLLDQDAGLIKRMGAAANVYRALHRYRTAVGKEVHKLTGDERDVLKMLIDLGFIYG